MNDMDLFRLMLERGRIPFEEDVNEKQDTTIKIERPVRHLDSDPNLQGYRGFYTEFVFSPQGVLKKVGIWEC
jgi:hypothetical protein